MIKPSSIMKKFIFLNLVCVLLCLSCTQDDDAPITNQLEASWSLINVSGSFAGIDQDIPVGIIVWTFNTTDDTVTIVNNNTDEEITDFFESGTYTYHFVNNEEQTEECSESLFVDEIDFGCQNITGNTMVVSNVWVDGYQLTFVKGSVIVD